ncbi:desmoplakin [Adoxophyes orana granulovirus]|uniref:Desmoplakin n=1 Tax=Adoxophyes orana granulovirus TaxID=170617 RepID=Q7T9S0_GVAO|nr:desmoplakin [Adoxophyes orana granulovirus]AAP85732.1 desmoplakin [Adoxophyes orana granulovirus]AIW65173.1 desmoplakin [Adoxophyes orana granulovirus]
MILTRYRGVDVTPQTFHNLIQTITTKSPSLVSGSSKTDFEKRIREIILAFNPTIKDCYNKSTEYLLINTLKINNNKQIVHTYNYKTWQNMSRTTDSDSNSDDNDDDNNIKETLNTLANKAWSDDVLIHLFKCLDKKTYKKIKKRYYKHIQNCNNYNNVIKDAFALSNDEEYDYANFLGYIRNFIDKFGIHTERCETIEDYKKKFLTIDNKITTLQQENITYRQQIQEFESVENALKSRYQALATRCDQYQQTISYNVTELARMGAEIGKRDEILEKLNLKHDTLTKQLYSFQSECDDYKKTMEKLSTACEQCKLNTSQSEQYQLRIEELLNDKLTLNTRLNDSQNAINELQNRLALTESQYTTYKDMTQKTNLRLQHENEACLARLKDLNSDFENKKAELNNTIVKCNTLEGLCVSYKKEIEQVKLENDQLKTTYDETCDTIKEKNEITSKYKTSLLRIDDLEKTICKQANAHCDQIETALNDNENSLETLKQHLLKLITTIKLEHGIATTNTSIKSRQQSKNEYKNLNRFRLKINKNT